MSARNQAMRNKKIMNQRILAYFSAILISVILTPGIVKADISYLLLESVGVSGEASSAGHSAIYFSNICAESPIEMRICRPGEMGIVIALYPDFGANKDYEWIAVPLIPYLYGVENESKIPLYVNGEIRTLLRERYRRNHLLSLVPDTADGSVPKGRWQQMIGNTYNRDIYSFTVRTSPKEDAALIEKINSIPNENRYSTLYHNCADFAREVINTYYPRAARRDVLNDFTMTSPKAVARSLSRYATKRPEMLFNIVKYSQLAGPIRRSMDSRNYSQMAFTSKKYLAPQLLFNRFLLAGFVVSYFTTGRFNTHNQYMEYATPEIASLNLEQSRLKSGTQNTEINVSKFTSLGRNYTGADDPDPRVRLNEIIVRKEAERLRLFGTVETWKKYQARFTPMLQKAIQDGLFLDEKEVKTFFKDLELQSDPGFDDEGRLMLRVSAYGEDQILGLTRDNILGGQSNPQLAYKLMLAKVNATLKAKLKNRESFETFEADWELMMRLSARSAETFQPAASRPQRFRVVQEKTTFGEKFKKIFVIITH